MKANGEKAKIEKTIRETEFRNHLTGGRMQVIEIDFQFLKINPETIRAIQNETYELGDYFTDLAEFIDKYEAIVKKYGFTTNYVIDFSMMKSNAPIFLQDKFGNIMQNYCLNVVWEHLDGRMKKPVEVIKYNCF
jgi:hypothetical protein